jgi:hypothetical protein
MPKKKIAAASPHLLFDIEQRTARPTLRVISLTTYGNYHGSKEHSMGITALVF